jgi:hypothetical protein
VRRENAALVGFTVAMAIAIALAPALEAGCPGAQGIDMQHSYVVTNPDWAGGGGTGTCPPYGIGCYDSDSGPPVSQTITGVFWSLGQTGQGTGNPVVGLGDDSGEFTGGFGPNDDWIKQVSRTDAYYTGTPFPGGLYHYPAWATLKLDPPFAPGPQILWSRPDVDGCGPDLPLTACTCVLLSDEWNGVGYFATLSARSTENGGTDMNPGETIRLAPIPAPRITSSVRNPTNGDVTLTVTHTALTGGTYPKDSCGNCLQGFKVYYQVLPRGSAAPTSRLGWTEAADGTGGTQPVTGLGGSATVRVECNPSSNQDMYLSVVLVGIGATPFSTTHVSSNSTLVHCGQTLANPDQPTNRRTEPGRNRGTGRDPSRDR